MFIIPLIFACLLAITQSCQASDECKGKPFVPNSFQVDATGESSSFTCARGYRLVGTGKIKCLDNGIWSVSGDCRKLHFDRKLIIAAIKSDTDRIDRLLAEDVDIDGRRRFDGRTALMVTAAAGQSDVVRHLLKRGARVNLRDSAGATPLVLAVKYNHTETARILVEEAGSKVHFSDTSRNGAFYWAVRNGLNHTLHLLVEHLNNETIRSDDANHLIRFAILRKNPEIVTFLVDHGVVNVAQLRVLPEAAAAGFVDLVRFLLSHGAAIDQRNFFSHTALIAAAKNNRTDVARLLIEKGADVNLATKVFRFSPLYWAAKNGLADLVRLLVDRKARVNQRTTKGTTALMAAALSNAPLEIVQFLVEEAGADVNSANIDGETALIFAARRGNLANVRLLLKHGADVDHLTTMNETALLAAVNNTRLDVAEFLIVNAGADVNLVGWDGMTALLVASEKGLVGLVRFLLRYGADVNVRKLSTKSNALILALKKNHTSVARMLIDDGEIDVNLKNKLGETALHWAARNGNEEIIPLLARYGADVNAATVFNETALMVATSIGNRRVVEMLVVDYEAKVNLRNSVGNTALHLALRYRFFKLAQFLVEHGASKTAHNTFGQLPFDLSKIRITQS